MVDNRKLNIVDEDGNIIGEETRENIHKQGLLHREIHVWFYTHRKARLSFNTEKKIRILIPIYWTRQLEAMSRLVRTMKILRSKN